MAAESINAVGEFVVIQAASSTANGALSTGTRTTISSALTTALGSVTEASYPILDFRLNVSVGTPTENGRVYVYRRSKADGVNESPAPLGSYKPDYVGSFTLDNTASSQYYYYSVNNVDKNATYYLENDDGTNTLTLELSARGRGYTTA